MSKRRLALTGILILVASAGAVAILVFANSPDPSQGLPLPLSRPFLRVPPAPPVPLSQAPSAPEVAPVEHRLRKRVASASAKDSSLAAPESTAPVALLVPGKEEPAAASFSFPAMGAAVLVPHIAHSISACFPNRVNPRVAVQITGPSAIVSGRVYFHAEGIKGDHYLEVRHGSGNQYWAALPLPAEETGAVVYRVVARDAQGREATTGSATALVAASCPAAPLTDEERMYASNLVIGLTAADQSSLPPGFLCKGIVRQITASGELRPNDACLGLRAEGAVGVGATALQAPVSSARPAAATLPN
ncbi:MAG: hypothetical protein ACRD1B_06530 [Thermoanaerobaculia bacterium]